MLFARERTKQHRWGIETILYAIALSLAASIFFKVILDVDNNYDPGWYHLPFAGRLGGILPREMFIGDEKWFEPRFDGFPLLAHFLQGIFWRITGRIQSANLVSFLAIVGYWFFLRSYFKVPLYLAIIALFSIPLVLNHASTSFVDLLGNVGTSILVMMTYSFYKNRQLPKANELFIAFLGAAIAANTKTQLQPLVFVILIVAGIRLCWLYWRQPAVRLIKIVPVSILATLIIFATPVKNTVLYGNPLYPIKIEVAGIVLNHKLSPEAYEEGNRQQNWVTSVLEINAPFTWTPDQWSQNPDRSRRGGFFGAYVVFNLLLLLGFWVRELIQNKSLPPKERSREARYAVFTAIAMSVVPLNFPQSHELRYFMYWMITLVSLNLYLICLPKFGKRLQPKYIGLVYLIFLAIVLSKIGRFAAIPTFYTLDKYVETGVKPEFLAQIKPDEKVCLLSRHIGEDVQNAPTAALKYAYLYSSYFHPELNYDYSIQAALDPQACGDRGAYPEGNRIIIPSNLESLF